MTLRSVLERSYEFLIKRKSKQGGFSFSNHLPPTIEDTYYCLRAIETLGNLGLELDYLPHQDRLLKLWLLGNSIWSEPRVFYHLLVSYRICKLEIDKRTVSTFLSLWEKREITLERAYYLVKISEFLGNKKLNIKISETPKVTRDYWHFLYLSERGFTLDSDIRNYAPQYIIACQNADGGFGFSPKTTSFIDTTFYCLRALELLNIKPMNYENLLSFILFCQTKEGGFARRPAASAFLDSTYYALYSIKTLVSFDLNLQILV